VLLVGMVAAVSGKLLVLFPLYSINQMEKSCQFHTAPKHHAPCLFSPFACVGVLRSGTVHRLPVGRLFGELHQVVSEPASVPRHVKAQ
jgi:hypothetical protein